MPNLNLYSNAEILEIIRSCIESVNNTTRGRIKVANVVLADDLYRSISYRRVILDNGQSVTLLQRIQDEYPGITFTK
jgi:enolase